MRILIFGGTTESRQLSAALADAGAAVTVSVVSAYGAQEQGEHPGVAVSVGPKATEDMAAMLEEMDLCIDATHPFAVKVTENIHQAAEEAGVERIRLRREDGADAIPDRPSGKDGTDSNGTDGDGERAACVDAAAGRPADGRIRWAKDREEAAEFAREEIDCRTGRILLTTGAKDLPFYGEELDREKLIARVLPSQDSIRACEEAGLDHRNIVAMQGPFSARLNTALIREYQIDVLITKESGLRGGFRDKLEACRECGITAVVIARPEDPGLTYEEVLAECLRRMGQEEEE